jgi:hypothetical protein
MATVGEASVQDDEWFGEGSAFDSGEDLAAALFALAGTARIDAIPKAESDWPTGMRDVRRSEGDSDFVEVARTGGLDGARRAGSMPNGTRTATTTPGTWSVRNPGEQLLPPKVSGRSGWTIRNSVAVLHRTEEAIAHLREEAVAMAFLAAAEACGRGRPNSLERRSHPR